MSVRPDESTHTKQLLGFGTQKRQHMSQKGLYDKDAGANALP